ncbi:MAG: 3-phosphoshikimate 1-carboxyvinyltransferase [Thermoplasmata archaeon]|jgi:3-phosphoshikimate 1-carboxyvinyltransferase|nr:3-phosphoshikimate 1-carboxyvinyltransferase [Thermoplasmata archaeon]
MSLRVSPSSVHGTVKAAPSKSYTHRALLLGLLAEGTTTVRDALLSEDPRATLQAVEMLGATVERGEAIRITSDGVVRAPRETIDCLNSGTTLRLLSAIVALSGAEVRLTGDASLRKRPMGPLLAALESLGAKTTSAEGNAPLAIRGPLQGGRARLPGDVSSQFVSALLLAGARTPQGVTVEIEGALKSEPYVDITREMMRDFGARVDGLAVPGGQSYRARDYPVPGDFSTAAFPLAAGALAGEVTVENLPERTAQGDRAIVELLRRFGARVAARGRSVTVAKAPLRGIEADLSDTPDLFPILCAIAAHAQGETVLSGAAHLRFKESDRIRAMVTNLQRLGVDAREREDGAIIRGGPVHGAGGLVTEGDHRVEMALAVCGLAAQGPLVLDDHEAHAVSYPAFLTDFQRLGASLQVIS